MMRTVRLVTVAAVVTIATSVLLPVAAPAGAQSATRPISWGRCSNPDLRKAHARCGYLRVPLDYADPSGPTIKLAVSRVRHTSSAADYQGVLLMNVGGPGLEGLDNPLNAAAFPRVAGDYDWIGLDPRGVGASIPALSCKPHYFVGPRPPYTPTSPAIARRWLHRAAGYTAACASSPGSELLAHDSTVDWAKDLESVRIALGAPQITFYGFSYGTYLGQVYATLYPSHVRRMVLDSNIDPRGDGYHVMLSMAPVVERNLNFWFGWLAHHHHVYHLGRTAHGVRRLFYATEAALAHHRAGGMVGPAEWVDIFFLTAFTTPDFYWPYLGDVFSGWVHHHRSGPLVSAYTYFAEDTTSDASYATFVAVRCMDSTWPRTWRVWRARARRFDAVAPFLTWGNAWYVMPCRTWPLRVSSRVDVDGHGVRALLLDDRFDGSIAYSANLAVRQRFPAASFVTARGGLAHTDSFANRCEHHFVSRYLATGALPPRQPGRNADATCAPDPRPTP